jgi:hypothetical protein
MGRYRVLINGQNFLLPREGRVQRLGFYTTRFVSAVDREAAKRLAIESVLNLPNLLDLVANIEQDPPLIDAEEVDELDSSDDSTDTGLAFYLDQQTN